MMDEPISIFCAGGNSSAASDHIDVSWHLTELLLSYKYGEKLNFRRSLDALRPYMDDKLYSFFEAVYRDSLWLNPISGKKGY